MELIHGFRLDLPDPKPTNQVAGTQLKMKLKSLPVLAAAASACAGEGADSCDIAALATMLTDGNVTTCVSQTGYAVASMIPPTHEQKTAICACQACVDALDTVQQLAPGECTFGTTRLYGDVIDPLTSYCSSGSGSLAFASSGSGAAVGSGSIAWGDGVIVTSPSSGSAIYAVASSRSASGMAKGFGSGSAMIVPPAIRTPRPATPTPTPSLSPKPSPSPTPAPATGGVVGVPPLSKCIVAVVLATMLASLL